MKRFSFYAAKGAGITFFLVSLPLAASGAVNDAPPETIVSKEGVNGLLSVINTFSLWLLGALIALAVVLILLSAYDFLTSGGDEKKVKEGKDKLIYALVAVGVGLLAWGLVLLIGQLFDSSASTIFIPFV
ncbi:MAG: hypothetical protein UW92_C0007G0007 [Candidatus Jorgensenbacteria bacterium GW2011_GWA2_45_13]|uniref:Uncharacterized protein n=1 Tax=Candidatus Jorgensenbacteria bacterium GW2011_GWA2_45_13 TaxID=1618662 RepID=A0A0G1L7J3_9BACT|nr:MAG: hypothetical protein UW92_C0007G0007 [Candidatus Jorgensenbacteria bacterium GW2011_GWA2_45_13]